MFIPLAELNESAIVRGCRDLQKQKVAHPVVEGEGVTKELTGNGRLRIPYLAGPQVIGVAHADRIRGLTV